MHLHSTPLHSTPPLFQNGMPKKWSTPPPPPLFQKFQNGDNIPVRIRTKSLHSTSHLHFFKMGVPKSGVLHLHLPPPPLFSKFQNGDNIPMRMRTKSLHSTPHFHFFKMECLKKVEYSTSTSIFLHLHLHTLLHTSTLLTSTLLHSTSTFFFFRISK